MGITIQYNYHIYVDASIYLHEMVTWCLLNSGPKNVRWKAIGPIDNMQFLFVDENDAILFKLTWK